MAIALNSYGTAAGVASLTPQYVNLNGAFDNYPDGTNPKLSTVESWINQISAALNVALANAGFVIPVTQADAKEMLASFVEGHAAMMVRSVNGAGKFAASNERPLALDEFFLELAEVANEWVGAKATGLKALGVDTVATGYVEAAVTAYAIRHNDPYNTQLDVSTQWLPRRCRY